MATLRLTHRTSPRDYQIAAAGGEFTLTGADATLSRIYQLAASAGAFTLTGAAVTLTYGPNFEWSSVSGATGYKIYWGTSTGTYTTGNQDVGNVVIYQSGGLGLSSGTTYYMVVRAYNGNGESTSSNEIQVLNNVQTGP